MISAAVGSRSYLPAETELATLLGALAPNILVVIAHGIKVEGGNAVHAVLNGEILSEGDISF